MRGDRKNEETRGGRHSLRPQEDTVCAGPAAAAVVAAERGREAGDPLVRPWIHERESGDNGAKDVDRT
jgi:hypothetical protein